MGNANMSFRHQAKIADREAKALDVFLAGATYAQVAKHAGYSDPSNARRAVHRAAARRREERDELADVALTLMLDQLDMLLRAHITTALDRSSPDQYKATDQVLRVLDRKAKLQGISAPVQVEATVRVKDELDDEIAALAGKLKAAAGEAGIGETPVLDSIANVDPGQQ